MGMMRAEKCPKVVCEPNPPNPAQQHIAGEVTPKALLAKFGAKQLKDILSMSPQVFSALPPASDLKEAMDLIHQGEDAFASLPSNLRNRFGNDPIKLLEFLHDPKSRDEAVSLGLLPRAAVTDEAKRKEVKKPEDSANNEPKKGDK